MSPARPAEPGPATPSFFTTRRALEHIRDVCRGEGSRNGYFAAMYSRVTSAVQRRAEAGLFADAARMELFVARFAGRYTEAYWARAAGQPTTRSWALAFDTADEGSPLVVQQLALGMNAHINLDLGVVAAEAAVDGAGTAPPVRPSGSLRADFLAINDVLAEMVDRCQAAVVAASPLLGVVDRVLGEGDEEATRFSLRLARAGAWTFACELVEAPATAWPAMVEARDTSIADLGGRLLTRAGPADDLRRLIRLGELRSVEDVIDLLSAIDDA